MGSWSLEMEFKKRTICLDQGKMEKKEKTSSMGIRKMERSSRRIHMDRWVLDKINY